VTARVGMYRRSASQACVRVLRTEREGISHGGFADRNPQGTQDVPIRQCKRPDECGSSSSTYRQPTSMIAPRLTVGGNAGARASSGGVGENWIRTPFFRKASWGRGLCPRTDREVSVWVYSWRFRLVIQGHEEEGATSRRPGGGLTHSLPTRC
jgi:hypothetical protein